MAARSEVYLVNGKTELLFQDGHPYKVRQASRHSQPRPRGPKRQALPVDGKVARRTTISILSWAGPLGCLVRPFAQELALLEGMGAPAARLVGVCGYWYRGEEEMKGYLHLYLWAKGWNSAFFRMLKNSEIKRWRNFERGIADVDWGSAYYVEVRVLEMYRWIFYRLFSLTDRPYPLQDPTLSGLGGKGFSSGMALRDWPELIHTPWPTSFSRAAGVLNRQADHNFANRTRGESLIMSLFNIRIGSGEKDCLRREGPRGTCFQRYDKRPSSFLAMPPRFESHSFSSLKVQTGSSWKFPEPAIDIAYLEYHLVMTIFSQVASWLVSVCSFIAGPMSISQLSSCLPNGWKNILLRTEADLTELHRKFSNPAPYTGSLVTGSSSSWYGNGGTATGTAATGAASGAATTAFVGDGMKATMEHGTLVFSQSTLRSCNNIRERSRLFGPGGMKCQPGFLTAFCRKAAIVTPPVRTLDTNASGRPPLDYGLKPGAVSKVVLNTYASIANLKSRCGLLLAACLWAEVESCKAKMDGFVDAGYRLDAKEGTQLIGLIQSRFSSELRQAATCRGGFRVGKQLRGFP
ncbi:hypothetical protein CCUS01_07512 [Colletotrichum cuscutae]|uniref:Uncharacterized protein n=1 Tax=Colletotrichum cuscutae TaxID=1209917 RepID=A0AAI9XZ28_9PEZI|nr:hypothetical protein CCUS01_07512 [Colletotrichum cuscutae]